MSDFLQKLIIALNEGSSYALIALGYTMVYGVLRLINFAHGDVFMIGAYVGAFAARLINPSTDANPSPQQLVWHAIIGLAVAMMVCGSVGFLIERIAYRPLRKSPKLAALITAIGVSLLIEYLAQMEWSPRAICITVVVMAFTIVPFVVNGLVTRLSGRRLFLLMWLPLNAVLVVGIVIWLIIGQTKGPAPFSLYGLNVEQYFGKDVYFGPTPTRFQIIEHSNQSIAWFERVLGVSVVAKDLIVPCTTLVTLAALWFIVQHTRMGKAMRAVSQNYDAARLMGIDIDRVISFTFILGSVLAAIGGCLWGLTREQCTPLMGLIPGLKAFVAAVIGGIGNIPGAAMGGLILGVIETYVASVQYHQEAVLTPYKDAISFLILIAVLLIKPEGIFGKAVPEKV